MDAFTKEDVIAGLDEVWKSTIEATEGLDEARWSRETQCPGWDSRAQLSHLIGIERSLMGEPAPEVEVTEKDHLKNPIGEMNEPWIVVRRSTPGDEVRTEFIEVTARRLEQLRSLDAAAFEEVGWSPIGQVPMREFMVIRIMDSWIHEQDIRVTVGRPGGRNGIGEQVALMRADVALRGVVGRATEKVDGLSVVIKIVGPLGGRRRFEIVEGRAQEIEGADATATVVIEQEPYLRRFAGRISADETLSAPGTQISGDLDLARRVVESLAVMI